MDRTTRRWAQKVAREHPEMVRIGYFGSYARGNWGVGSDLDFVPYGELPVSADLLVYTRRRIGKSSSGRRSGYMAQSDPTNAPSASLTSLRFQVPRLSQR